MRKGIENMKIVLNHKCNLTKNEFLAYQQAFAKIKTAHDIVMCPTSLYLPLFHLENISLGSQDVSTYEMGAHTGEISASQLKEMNVEYTIVGHSERRSDFDEKDNDIKEKIAKLLAQGITPILCVGETSKEREKGERIEVIKRQLSILSSFDTKKIIIAYEPVWAIGTGLVPTVEELDEVLTSIHFSYPESLLLYGGSASDENIEYLKTSQEIDGYLLGGLSLKLEKLQVFLDLC